MSFIGQINEKWLHKSNATKRTGSDRARPRGEGFPWRASLTFVALLVAAVGLVAVSGWALFLAVVAIGEARLAVALGVLVAAWIGVALWGLRKPLARVAEVLEDMRRDARRRQ